MPTLAAGSSVTATLTDGGVLSLSSNSGEATVTVTPTAGAVQTFTLGPRPTRRSVGPLSEGGTVLIVSSTAEVIYECQSGCPASALTSAQVSATQALVSGGGIPGPMGRIVAAVRSPRFSRSVMATPPTITLEPATVNADNWTVSLKNAVRYIYSRSSGSGGSLTLASKIYRYAESLWTKPGGGYQCFDGTTSEYYMPGDSTALNSSQEYSPAVIGFSTDSPYFGVTGNSASLRATLFVKEPESDVFEMASASATAFANGSYYISYKFTTRKPRDFVLVLGPFARFGELVFADTDTIQPLNTTLGSFTAAVMTDSYGQYPTSALPSAYEGALSRLGTLSVTKSTVGGTGYSADAVASGALIAAALTRLNYMLSQAPDLGLFALGINDAWPTGTYGDTNTKIAACFAAYRAAVPTGLLVAMTPYAPSYTAGQGTQPQAIRSAILANLQIVGGPWVFLDNLNGTWQTSWGTSGTRNPWQTGDGRALTLTGSITAATSSTLSAAWAGTTGSYNILFSSGDKKAVTLTNGSTALSWTGAVTATASIGAYTTTPGNSVYYVNPDGTHPTTAGAEYIEGSIFSMLKQAILSVVA